MSTDIAESLPKRKFAPAPMIAKGAKGEAPAPKKGCLLYTSPSPRDPT